MSSNQMMSLSQIMSESDQHVTESNVSFVTDLNDVIEKINKSLCRSIGYCLSLVNMLESKHVRQDQ